MQRPATGGKQFDHSLDVQYICFESLDQTRHGCCSKPCFRRLDLRGLADVAILRINAWVEHVSQSLDTSALVTHSAIQLRSTLGIFAAPFTTHTKMQVIASSQRAAVASRVAPGMFQPYSIQRSSVHSRRSISLSSACLCVQLPAWPLCVPLCAVSSTKLVSSQQHDPCSERFQC
jgi:hypothetical protein